MIESLTNFWRWMIVDGLPIVLAVLTIPALALAAVVVGFVVWAWAAIGEGTPEAPKPWKLFED